MLDNYWLEIALLTSIVLALFALKFELEAFKKEMSKILAAFSIIARTNANGATIEVIKKEVKDENRRIN